MTNPLVFASSWLGFCGWFIVEYPYVWENGWTLKYSNTNPLVFAYYCSLSEQGNKKISIIALWLIYNSLVALFIEVRLQVPNQKITWIHLECGLVCWHNISDFKKTFCCENWKLLLIGVWNVLSVGCKTDWRHFLFESDKM